MTPLAGELHRILESGEVLQASSFARILYVTGYDAPHPIPLADIEAAMTELINGGLVQREWRRRRAYFAAMPTPKAEPTAQAGRRATIAHPPATLTPGEKR